MLHVEGPDLPVALVWSCVAQDRDFDRVAVQQLCVEVMPWLDWVGPDKAAEVHALAMWLSWLADERHGQGVRQGVLVHDW